MKGFVKLRRGLAEHVSKGRMTLTEHGAYTLLLQLADHNTGRWRGTQRSFAAAAAISSSMAWKILTSLEEKGYLSWDRERQSVQIAKFFMEKPVENPVEKPVEIERRLSNRDHSADQVGHARDRYIRNTRTLLEKKDIAASAATTAASPPSRILENQKHDPAVMATILSAMRQIAFAKSINRAEVHPGFPRVSAASVARRRAGNHFPP
jgi:uncharacterized protein YdaU (DUF1376 family)